jgi:hypothetical protein
VSIASVLSLCGSGRCGSCRCPTCVVPHVLPAVLPRFAPGLLPRFAPGVPSWAIQRGFWPSVVSGVVSSVVSGVCMVVDRACEVLG